jgi:hypothetical protein
MAQLLAILRPRALGNAHSVQVVERRMERARIGEARRGLASGQQERVLPPRPALGLPLEVEQVGRRLCPQPIEHREQVGRAEPSEGLLGEDRHVVVGVLAAEILHAGQHRAAAQPERQQHQRLAGSVVADGDEKLHPLGRRDMPHPGGEQVEALMRRHHRPRLEPPPHRLDGVEAAVDADLPHHGRAVDARRRRGAAFGKNPLPEGRHRRAHSLLPAVA